MKKILLIVMTSTLLIVGGLFTYQPLILDWIIQKITSRKTVSDRLEQYQVDVESRLKPLFADKQINFPPTNVTLVFLKDKRELQLFASNEHGKMRFIRNYKVLAASGKIGPKLREGDYQVPEGIYKVESLNPNSLYHLSLRLNYPNPFDKKMAEAEGREDLGSDIMIHGKKVSIGCIAIGDKGIEEVFVLAALSNYQNWNVILAPTDLRKVERPKINGQVPWISDLDKSIAEGLAPLPDNEM